MICEVCRSEETLTIKLPTELLTVCHTCGYGRPSTREPMHYDESYEAKYLNYPEKDICDIRLACLPDALDTIGHRQKLLDYGCGSGAFVHAARAAGFDAYGFDVNDFTADLRPPKGFTPDIVTAWDSFEHLTDVQQDGFFAIAKSAYSIALSVPDFRSASILSVLEWRHYRPAEHLHYYTLESLRVRFAREGFNVLTVSHAEDAIRQAPWKNNILSVGFYRVGAVNG